MYDNSEKPKHGERPPGIYITWTQLVVVFIIVVVFIGVLSVALLSAPVTATPAIQSPEQSRVYESTVAVDAAQGWQPTGLRLQPGQGFTVQYLQGTWSIFPGDEQRYTADGGAAPCGQPDCVEPIPNYTKSGLIGRIGDSAPFPVGSYLETTAQYEGMLQLRVNDAGTHDNEGGITVRVTTP